MQVWVDRVQKHPAVGDGKDLELIAQHQGLVYLFGHSTIKSLNLRELRKKNDQSFKQAKVPLLDFTPKQTEFNTEGRMIAIAGECKLIIAVTAMIKTELLKETFEIGSKYHNQYNKIVKILWHPLSDSHLLVLQQNGSLRMYNVKVDFNEPEQIFYLCGTSNRKSFGPNKEEFEAIDFSMGLKSWEQVTIFGLLRSGDLVTISPVLPNESTITALWIEQAHKDLKLHKASTQEYWAEKFLDDLVQDFKLVQRPLRNLKVGRRVWLFHPSCDVVDQLSDPTSISVLSGETACVVLAFRSGLALVGLALDVLLPFWILEKEVEKPVLFVHELLQLECEGRINMYTDSFTPDTVYLVAPNEVYQIQLEICTSFDDLEQTAQKSMLVLTSIKSFTIINEMSFEFSYICLGSILVADLIFPIKSAAMPSVNNPKLPYKSHLKSFDYNTLQNCPKNVQKGQTMVYPMDENKFSLAVKQFTLTREKIEQILASYGEIQQHTTCLQLEEQTQQKFIEQISARIKKIQSRVQERKNKSLEISSKSQELQKRTSAILELLFDLTQPSLSAVEIKWFTELQETLLATQLLEPELGKLKKIEVKIEPEEELGQRQIKDVKANLNLEFLELKALAKRIDDLHYGLDGLNLE